MSISRLDKIYRRVLFTTFFTKGWGYSQQIHKLLNFRHVMSNRNSCLKLVSPEHKISILHEHNWNGYRIIDGKFRTPLADYLPGIVSPEVEDSYFQLILPKDWKCSTYRPVCIHLAGTGDHYFWQRRHLMAMPLLKNGIAAVLVENPYYGLRKPKDQVRSSLHHVSDIFVMGGCLILECIVLLRWCERMGLGPLGVTGISMGGHMASLAATNWPKPLVVVPCLSWTTASLVFTEGVMSDAIDWDLLQRQYFEDPLFYNSISNMCRILDNPLCSNLGLHITGSDYYKYAYKNFSFESISPNVFIKCAEKCAAYTNIESSKKKDMLLSSVSSTNLLNLLKSVSRLDSTYAIMKQRDKEAVCLMRGLMDECTHLKNFEVPYDPSLAVAVAAKCDGYVPRDGCSNLEDLWPGSTVRYVDSGHVGAYLWHLKTFQKTIVETFEKAKKVCDPPKPYSF